MIACPSFFLIHLSIIAIGSFDITHLHPIKEAEIEQVDDRCAFLVRKRETQDALSTLVEGPTCMLIRVDYV